MKLHRANTKPDWELVAPASRNPWQRLAASTNGVVTPGNVLSVIGVGLVGVGLTYVHGGQLWRGLWFLAVGRLCDLADGIAAERTGTKSPLGEAVDASLDKLAAFAALVVFALAGVMPWGFALLIGLQNGATAVLSAIAKSTKRVIHPVSAGKIGGAIEWGALLCFVLGKAVHGTPADMLTVAAYSLAFIAIGLNTLATSWYVRAIYTQPGRTGKRRG